MEYFFSFFSTLLTFILMSVGGLPLETPVLKDSSGSLFGTSTATVIYVIDGDTIDVVMEGSSDPVRVRYIGIDTPEPYREAAPECGSKEATKRNTDLVASQKVTIVPGTDQFDSYSRLLAYVYVGEVFVNETLVSEGYANVMMIKPNTQYYEQFMKMYKKAKHEERGIWQMCK